MFAKRLTVFWIALTVLAVVLALRLVDIQVLHADEYDALAARLLTRPVRYLNAPRGSIRDRWGRILVSDEPSYDVCVHYAVLTGRNRSYLRTLARHLRRQGEFPKGMALNAAVEDLQRRVESTWQRLAALSGRPRSEFADRGAQILRQVRRIREAVRRRTGIDQPVLEEYTLHPLLQDVSDELALQIRLELGDRPWLAVVPSSHRAAHEADAAVHLLGRLGAVSPERLEQDPFRGDPLRALHPGDRCGVSGIERLAETTLRGVRGRIVEDLDGREIEHLQPVPGEDVILAIDMELQENVLAWLGEAVENAVHPAGGAAVVLDAGTREVLALVSYPTYAYDTYRTDYPELIRDARRLPTRFRAVNGLYPPGSTCKAITLVAALAEGVTTPEERIHCTGALLPDHPDRFRCWIYNQYGITHDATQPEGQDGADAVRNSCNIYFFKLGSRLGPQTLCDWFRKFGLGRTQGTGLIEEASGLVPSEPALRRRFRPSDAWNYAIGQGEVTATPLQVANVAASVATGYWAPVQLIRNDPQATPKPRDRAFPPETLRVLRKGMYRVVNERGGTGYRARLDRTDYVLCGKTGSAQAVPRPVKYRYTFEWPGGRRETVDAYLEEDARAAFGEDQPRRVGKHTIERYPALLPGEHLPAHAWFMGYTQSADTPPGAPPRGKVYALAVLVEYGGSGGRVAGPVAKRIAEWLLENRP